MTEMTLANCDHEFQNTGMSIVCNRSYGDHIVRLKAKLWQLPIALIRNSVDHYSLWDFTPNAGEF